MIWLNRGLLILCNVVWLGNTFMFTYTLTTPGGEGAWLHGTLAVLGYAATMVYYDRVRVSSPPN